MRKHLYIPTFVICAFAVSIHAQEVVLDGFSGIGARAMGMGGAYISVSDDFSGLFWNPAGLAQIERGTVNWGVSHDRFRNISQFFDRSSTFELRSTRIASLGFVYPVPVYRGSLVFAGGFGRNRNFDGGLQIDAYDTSVNFDKAGFSEDKGALGAWTLGAAIDLMPRLSAGISLFRWGGTNRFMQELTLEDVQRVHADTVRIFQRFESEERYSAWGIQGGIRYWHPTGFRFGIVATAATPLRVSAELADEFEDEFEDRTDTYPRESFSDTYEIRQPLTFGMGIGWSAGGLTVSGDVHYGDLQEVTYEVLPVNIAPNVDDFRRQYRSEARLNLGCEYAISRWGIAFRGGYYRDPVRYVGGGSVPEIQIETDRNAWTLGFGTELEKAVTLDFAAVIGGYKAIEGNRADRVRAVRVLASARFYFFTGL